ncbi:MAG: ferritin-like domain-containing protein [Planctomycetota bacterium]|nr:ferritin-like domain-containing protein [Planctomycetaceae bacterium]MDQ3329444.1 ferritin-like domain-containing protein [Planctomycetota bacterium]
MKIESLDKLFVDELKDIYSAESQLIRALPKMAKAATSPMLREAFESHLEETKIQKERLDQIGEQLGQRLTGKKCVAMEGLIEEGKEILEADGLPSLIDAALIAAAQRVEHYEISAYGTARALAQHLGHADAVKLLDTTIHEEGAADHKLTKIAESDVYPGVRTEQEEAENAPKSSNGRAKKGAKKRASKK